MSFLRAHINDEDFASRFAALQAMKREQSVDVNEAVAAIIDDVRQRGDDALIALTEKYDRQTLNAETLRIGDDEIDSGHSGLCAGNQSGVGAGGATHWRFSLAAKARRCALYRCGQG